jgi:hypothetical protein
MELVAAFRIPLSTRRRRKLPKWIDDVADK